MKSRLIPLVLALPLIGCATFAPEQPVPRAQLRAVPAAPKATTPKPVSDGTVRTLQQAVELCLARNPNLFEAEARVHGAEAALAQARAALYPMVGAQLAVLWADAPSTYLFKSIDAGRLGPNTNFNDPGSLRNTEASLGASWNLWRGGVDSAGIRAAQLGIEAGTAAQDAARNALVAAVSSAWLELRATRELAASDDARVRTLEEQLSNARKRLENGAALRIDVLSLEVRLAQAQERRTRTELGRKLALAGLRQLLALDEAAPIEPDESLPGSITLPATREGAQGEAQQHRGELVAALSELEAAKSRLEMADRAWTPRLDLMARVWGGETDVSLDLQRTNSQVALVLSVDALDGGMRSAGLAGARAQFVAADARMRSTELAVANDVDRAWYGLEEATAMLDVAERAEKAAGEGLGLAATSLEGGATTVSRYLDAESDHAQARAQLVLARIHVQRAGFELRRATGTLQEVTW